MRWGRWLGATALVCGLCANNASPLTLRLDLAFANPSLLDPVAMYAAKRILENITTVSTPYNPQRWTYGMQTDCTPYVGSLTVPAQTLGHREILVMVYTEGRPPDGAFCNGELAFARICITELGDRIPAVALVNICPSSSQRTTSYGYNLRVWLHEFVHVMGMVPSVMYDTMGYGEPDESSLGITGAGPVAWAQEYYSCPAIESVPVIGGHWDPFFVGADEIMTACISPRAVLSYFTLFFLDSLGFYDMLPEHYGLHDVIAPSAHAWGGNLYNLCNFATFQCMDLRDAETGVDVCSDMCVEGGEKVVASEVDILVVDAILRRWIEVEDLLHDNPSMPPVPTASAASVPPAVAYAVIAALGGAIVSFGRD